MDEINKLLVYSNEKLNNIFNEIPNKNEAIISHIKSANYPNIGDFKEGLEWFNVSEPITFSKHLKGKLVLLDFFTYCCINCMHILPDLKAIEKEFSVEDGLVVIGVHSAKFENERLSDNILSAVQRYNISHPVVNDANLDLWTRCEIFSWPTLLLLDPQGNPLIMYMGEGHRDNLILYIRNALNYYKSKNKISNHLLPIESAQHLLPSLKDSLKFPGKIATFNDENNSEILAVSDTGNHRILLIKSDGTIMKLIGNGKEGFKDGNIKDAQFRSPQGLIFQNKFTLYVADTENHAIRKIDLKEEIVETIIGTGVQGIDRVGGNTGKQQVISSPWDLCLYNYPQGDMLMEILIIAMSGTHQIWAYFIDDTIWWKDKKYTATTCIAIAGSGNEENRNNQYPLKAAFAQPSGLAICNKRQELYIADSESSSIRRLSLLTGKVTAVVGGERDPCNLFAFGDKDGTLYEAKLQHPLGLTITDDQRLFIADSYNHKLKQVDVIKNTISTIDLNELFNEPGGVAISKVENNKVYVADTNNHCIKVITLSKNEVEKLHLQLENEVTDSAKTTILESIPTNVSSKGAKFIFKMQLNFLNGTTLTEGAPQKWSVNLPNSTWSCTPTGGKDLNNVEALINVPPFTAKSFVELNIGFYLCSGDTCTPKDILIRKQLNPCQTGEDNSTIHLKVNANNISIDC